MKLVNSGINMDKLHIIVYLFTGLARFLKPLTAGPPKIPKQVDRSSFFEYVFFFYLEVLAIEPRFHRKKCLLKIEERMVGPTDQMAYTYGCDS